MLQTAADIPLLRRPTVTAASAAPGSLARPWWAERSLWIVAALTFAVNLWGITWGLPNVDHDWAIDSIAPFGPLRYAREMLYGGHWWSKYPPLHFTILTLVYAPYVALLSWTGVLEANAAAVPLPAVSFPLLVLLARLTSAAMGVGAAVAAYLIARELADRRAGFIAGALFAGSPLACYYGSTANLDVPYLFWSSLGLLALVRIARGGGTAAYVALGACAAAAIATKDQAYGLFLALPLALVAARVRVDGAAGLRDRRVLLGGLTALLVYVLAANLLIDPSGWLAHLHYVTHDGSRPYQMFPATPAGYAALAVRTADLLVRSFTAPAVLLALAGVAVALARRLVGAGWLLLAAGAYLVLFPGVILYVFPRFLLPVIFVLAIFAGIAGAALWQSRHVAARGVLVAIVAYTLAYGTSMNLGLLWDSRYAAEAWMETHIPPGAVVGTNGEGVYLPRLPVGLVGVRVEVTPSGLDVADDGPDFLVLSDAYYARYLRKPDLRPVVERLLAGDLGYEPVGSFQQPYLPATALIPSVNPRIVILKKRLAATD